MASACREEILVLLLAYIDAAAAAADENTGIWLAGSQSGIAPGFARRDDTEQRRPRVSLGIGAAVAVLTRERQRLVDGDRWNRSRNAAGITRRIELSDRSTPADAVAQMMPIRLASNAERRYRADAGYHHARRLPVGRHDVTIIFGRARSRGPIRALRATLPRRRCTALRRLARVFLHCVSDELRRRDKRPGHGKCGYVERNDLYAVCCASQYLCARWNPPVGRTDGSCGTRTLRVRLDSQSPVHRRLCMVEASCRACLADRRSRCRGCCGRFKPPASWLTLRSAVVLDFRELSGLREPLRGLVPVRTPRPNSRLQDRTDGCVTQSMRDGFCSSGEHRR